MIRNLRGIEEDLGQGLVEYSLILAFVALSAAAFFIGSGQSVGGIWTTNNARLTQANTAADGGSGSSGSGSGNNGQGTGFGGGNGNNNGKGAANRGK